MHKLTITQSPMLRPFPLAHSPVLNALVSYKSSTDPLPPILLTLIHLESSFNASWFSSILHTDSPSIRDFKNTVEECMVWRTYKEGKMISEEKVGSESNKKRGTVRLLEMTDLDEIPDSLRNEFEAYKVSVIDKTCSKKQITLCGTELGQKEQECIKKEVDKLGSLPNADQVMNSSALFYSEVDYRGYSQRKKRGKAILPLPILPEQKKKKFMNLTVSFNINKIEQPRCTTPNMNLRFQPISLTHHITTYSHKTSRVSGTYEKPLKLTFIKFHDQIKPPTFCAVKKAGERITFKRISNVSNYDVDSDENWIYEDGESIDSSDTESEEEASDDDGWIDKSDVVETSMKYKKPEIMFVDIKIEYYKEFSEDYLNIPLKREIKFNENLVDLLRERLDCGKSREDVCRNFAAEFNIVIGAVRQKTKELKEHSVHKN